ncbi:hypothetical protein A6M21_12250 [Desulfotomaculum copahuensis]|uniref:Uncharacterized protein n=1 Tax=Desulfotomaculum copahuensis TaxID=1838280 RepID=A0A1B7LD78_9FIRM|nr:hypothetical protein A6M21_12250 [Desulfotomaculum copahuensis]
MKRSKPFFFSGRGRGRSFRPGAHVRFFDGRAATVKDAPAPFFPGGCLQRPPVGDKIMIWNRPVKTGSGPVRGLSRQLCTCYTSKGVPVFARYAKTAGLYPVPSGQGLRRKNHAYF